MPPPRRENQIDFIELPAPDPQALARAQAFFSEAFGWSFKSWGEDYVDTADSGVGSGLNADPEHRPPAPLAVIYVRDLEAARSRVEKAGGILTRAPFAFPGGRRFHLRDPAGNALAVWSDR